MAQPFGLDRRDAIGLAYLTVQFGSVRAEHRHQVQRGGEHRLEDLLGDRLGLVLGPPRRHLGHRRGGRSAPRAQAGPDPGGGEQLPVVDQVDDDLGGRAPHRRALLADDGAVLVGEVAPESQVCLAVLRADLCQVADSAPAEPAEEPDGLFQPSDAAAQVKGCAIGPRQCRDSWMARGEHGQHELLGDQAPVRVGDRGEIEAPVRQGHIDRQPDHVGEVPQVVLEGRAASLVRQCQAGLAADVGTGERRDQVVLQAGGGGHIVSSSGRSGISSSVPATIRAAASRPDGSKRSSTWLIRAA